MVLLVLAAVVALIVLAVLKVVPLALAGIGILVMLLVAGWRFDRARGRGAATPLKDVDRPSFHGEAPHWQTPTPYIDHPDGGGRPPGVDRGDEPAAQR